MVAQYTQRAVINPGSTSAPAHTFPSSVTTGAGVVVCIWGGAVAYTSVSDNKSNTYTKRCTTTSGSGTRFEIWTALNVTGGSSFTVTGNCPTSFHDIAIFEYAASLTASIRVANVAQFPGGAKIKPQVALTGTTTGDLVVGMAYTANFSLLGATGSLFGANATTSTTDDSISTGGGTGDAWLITEGQSDGSSPMTVAFGTTTDDWYGAAAVAFVPGASAATSDPSGSAGARQLRTNAIYRMSPENDARAQKHLRAQKRAYGFASAP